MKEKKKKRKKKRLLTQVLVALWNLGERYS